MVLRPFKRFKKEEEGGVTVEAALWMPFFLILMFGIAEIAFVFHGHSRALQVAQEANRQYAIGKFASLSEAETWAATAMSNFSDEIIVDTTFTSELMVRTTISIPAKDFAGNIGIFSMLSSFRILATAQQVVET